MVSRSEINAYELGEALPLAPLEDRRRAVPERVWALLRTAKERVGGVLGGRLREMRLFGSYARGDFDAESDVDVLVVVESLAPGERATIVDAVCDVSSADALLSPLILTADELETLRSREHILASDIDREGIAI